MPEPEDVPDVGITIAADRWSRWDTLEIKRSLTSMRTVSFGAPFEPERPDMRAAFRPFSFQPLELTVDGEGLFVGTLVGVEPATTPTSRTVKVSAYSRPSVLSDVTMPASAYPLELNELSLRQIAETLLAPFGLEVVLVGDEGATFRRVAIDPDKQVLPFLIDLANQRGLVLSDTADGKLRIWKSIEGGTPVARFVEGEAPLLNVRPAFAAQSYFSEVTGIAKTRSGRGGSRYTVQNPHLDVLRPTAFTLEDTDGPDVPAAASAKLGRMLGNAAAWTIDVPTWRTSAGELWTPNTSLVLTAPGAMIYRETELIIRDVALRQDAQSFSAELGLVLPGAFSGEIPEVLPWD